MFKHLLVPTDGSALSEAAIQMAVTLAGESNARLTAVHVIPQFHAFAYGAEAFADTEEQFLKEAEERADRYLAAVMKVATQASVECDTVATRRAHPYEAIISVAKQKNCDLIVMASHGRSGVRALLIGSETQKVLTHSNIPVLVVRPSAAVGTGREAEHGASSTGSPQSPMQTFIVARAVIPVRTRPR